MTCASATLIRFSIATIIGGAALFWNGHIPAGFAIVPGVISRSQDRSSADADELRGRRSSHHSPSCGGWSRGGGCRGGYRLCGTYGRVWAGCGCLRANCHRLSVMSHCGRQPSSD